VRRCSVKLVNYDIFEDGGKLVLKPKYYGNGSDASATRYAFVQMLKKAFPICALFTILLAFTVSRKEGTVAPALERIMYIAPLLIIFCVLFFFSTLSSYKDRVDLRYLTFTFDAKGICEVWDYPDGQKKKEFAWSELGASVSIYIDILKQRRLSEYEVLAFLNNADFDMNACAEKVKDSILGAPLPERELFDFGDGIYIILEKSEAKELYERISYFCGARVVPPLKNPKC